MGASVIAGAAMFAYVLYRTRQAERDNPPLGEFMEVDGVRLHYVERGQGQPLVLLHGNGTMIQDFDTSGLVDLASRRYRVFIFDRPGYGYSTRPRGGKSWNPKAQADLLHNALQRLGVERPIVVGHSWGTLVALSLALSYPAYVRSLVLLSGYYFPTIRLDVPLLSPPAIPVLGDIMRYTISPLLGRIMWPGLLRIMFGPPAAPPRFDQFPVWMALRPKQIRASAAESGLMIPSVFALRHHYSKLTMPVTIMAGANDRFVSASRHSVFLHDELPHSDLRLAEGAGHMVHHVVPHEVMAAIDSLAEADPDSLNDAMQPAAKQREANTPAAALQSGRAATDPVLSG
ncbi:MAG TPA: alpha/beta hydrolase [Gammaproteobacteria bacterium]|nr:alpha/beta hydrolase [Gammaproteobacteria bacterium]